MSGVLRLGPFREERGEEGRKRREDNGSQGVMWIPCRQLTAILTSFGLFNIISYGKDLTLQ